MNKRGLTLIEIALVLALLGILAGIGIPHLSSLSRKSSYMLARQIVSDLRYTRTLAITSGYTHYLKFLPRTPSEPEGPPGYGSYAIYKEGQTSPVSDEKQIPSNLTCTPVQNEIYFYSLGNASVGGRVITIDDGDSQRHVYIIPSTGRVYEGS